MPKGYWVARIDVAYTYPPSLGLAPTSAAPAPVRTKARMLSKDLATSATCPADGPTRQVIPDAARARLDPSPPSARHRAGWRATSRVGRGARRPWR